MELLHRMQQLFFITVRVALKKVRTNKHKAKGLGSPLRAEVNYVYLRNSFASGIND